MAFVGQNLDRLSGLDGANSIIQSSKQFQAQSSQSNIWYWILIGLGIFILFRKNNREIIKNSTVKLPRQKHANPAPSPEVVKIYDNITAIEARKGHDSFCPGEIFRHDFKRSRGKASIYGLPDGSLLIKGKKKLWKNFK